MMTKLGGRVTSVGLQAEMISETRSKGTARYLIMGWLGVNSEGALKYTAIPFVAVPAVRNSQFRILWMTRSSLVTNLVMNATFCPKA